MPPAMMLLSGTNLTFRFDIVKAKKVLHVPDTLQRFYQAEVLVPSPLPPHLIVFPKQNRKTRLKA